ncbi:MAG: hypothetical protein AB1726_08350 [Planctomycetota bacterium]
MSLLLGSPADRWPLPQAVDALVDSARRAGIPGPIWIAGVLYPSLNLSWDLVRSMLGAVERSTGIELPGAAGTGDLVGLFLPRPIALGEDGFWAALGVFLVSLPLLLVYYRLVVGLARVCDPLRPPDEPGRPRCGDLRSAWREGRGLGFAGLGMCVLLLGLLLAAMLVLIGPLVMLVQILGLEELSPLFVGLLAPVLLVLLLYTVVLLVVNQLALHSLAHNRRGIASALTHAWRLIRTSPWSAARATSMDLVLFVTVLAITTAIGSVLAATVVMRPLYFLVVTALYGFAGVTRAGFWARSYRALGGLSAADQVPGL